MQRCRSACEFASRKCRLFVNGSNKLCKQCHHANIWHSLSRPPTDAYLSFASSRKSARRPIYIYYNKPSIFTPISPIPEEKVQESSYCDELDNLPA